MMREEELVHIAPTANETSLVVISHDDEEENALSLRVLAPRENAQHPAAVYLASLALGSRRIVKSDLDTLAGILTSGRCDSLTLDWAALRYQHAAALRSELAGRYAYTTCNRMISGLRGVLKAAWRLGQMPTEEYHRAVDIKAVRGETLPRGRALSAGELRVLFAGCADGRNMGVRDQALLAVLYGCGLRRSEAVALDVENYDSEAGTLRVLAGKGNKQRLVHLPPGAKQALDRWVWLREETLGTQESAQHMEEEAVQNDAESADENEVETGASTRENHSAIYKDRETTDSAGKNEAFQFSNMVSAARAPLFVPILKSRNPTGGRMLPRRLTDQSVLDILTRRAKQAGLKKTSPHDFRRTFISDLLEAGADIATVQKMAGHANVTTTARYDRRDEKTRKKAAHLLHVPVT